MYSVEEKRSFLPIFHSDFLEPEPELVKKVIKAAGFSQTQVAKITGVAYSADKGSTSVRRWIVSKSDKNYREIDLAKWRLIVEAAGLSSTEDSLALLKG